MTSTRKKNTYIDYLLEKEQTKKYSQYTNDNIIFNDAKISGNGFLPVKLNRNCISTNSIDTESFLFGINSANLEKQYRKEGFNTFPETTIKINDKQ
jgi:hypothetical protein